MSYLLDRKQKRKKIFQGAVFVIVIFTLFYFRAPVASGLSYVSHAVFRPFLVTGSKIGQSFTGLRASFSDKSSLLSENENLRAKLREEEIRLSGYDSLLDENTKLKEIMGRKSESSPVVLAAILSKPNKSPYDTLILDVGIDHGLKTGDGVFALGDVPIGRIQEVYPASAKAVLFSTSREKTEVVLEGRDVFVEIVGRGGGNFEMILPRDFTVVKGDRVVLPGLSSSLVAVVETVISDPRDAFSKALLVSPINIYELKFVQVKIQK